MGAEDPYVDEEFQPYSLVPSGRPTQVCEVSLVSIELQCISEPLLMVLRFGVAFHPRLASVPGLYTHCAPYGTFPPSSSTTLSSPKKTSVTSLPLLFYLALILLHISPIVYKNFSLPIRCRLSAG